MITCPIDVTRILVTSPLPRSPVQTPLAALLLVVALTMPARPARAQAGLTNGYDATLPPRGVVRLRVHTEWTRFDAIMGGLGAPSGARSLGSLLTTDALGSTEFPALQSTDAALQALTGDASVRASLGRVESVANSRVVVTPIALDYSLTGRLTIGAMLPVVQTRTTLITQLNAGGRAGNLGRNPGTAAVGAQVFNAFSGAAQTLADALAQCATTPGSPVCSRQEEASALLQGTRAFAAGVQELYGSPTRAGQPFIPFEGQSLLMAIQARQQALSQQYASFFGTGINAQTLPGSDVTLALDELQSFLRSQGFGSRRDSLGTIERLGVGDTELSAAFRLGDGFRDTVENPSGGASRMMVQGVVRLPSGIPVQTGLPYEIGTGGRFDVEARAAADLRFTRRFGLSLTGQYTLGLGSRRIPFVPGAALAPFSAGSPFSGEWKPGPLAHATATPHIRITDYFGIDLHYAFLRRGSDHFSFDPVEQPDDELLLAVPGADYDTPVAYEHRGGFGFSYASLTKYRDGRRPLPIEISFVHLETLRASGGIVPKARRDQLQLSIYYQLLGR
jgi:hypothetical protein